MQYERFVVAMKALAVNAGVDLPKDVLNLYFKALKNIPTEDFEQGIKKVLLTWEYNRIPPLAIIIKAIQGNEPGQIEDNAEIQATHVISCIGQKKPVFSDSVTAHLMVRRWPWHRWAPTVLESELKWWVKEFKDAYRAFSGSETPLQIEGSMPAEIKKLAEGIG